MGRQRSGALTLMNHPQFLQSLTMPRLRRRQRQIDVAALDVLRDRERGVPRFNEFRRQLWAAAADQFRRFHRQTPPRSKPGELLREVYGQHACDASKIITDAQLDQNSQPINDCLGYPSGSMVDNVEDVDTVAGWLAESTRPHGFAISETQFQVFILNASRRLFSDRFFTSSFRPEYYTKFGIQLGER